MAQQKNNPIEIGLKKFILPQQYVDEKLDKETDEGYLGDFVKNETHQVLQSFLNGGFSKAGFALYPLVQDVSFENRERLERIRKVVCVIRKRNKEFKLSSAFSYPLKSPFSCAQFLALLSKDFSSLQKEKTIQARKKPCDPFDISGYDIKNHGYLRPVVDLAEYAKKYLSEDIKGFYLHGSIATNDFVRGWSDCDTLLVISREASEDPKRILSLRKNIFLMRRFFFRIDPLQHHGCMILAEHDLGSYPQSYFPLPLFSYSKALTHDSISVIHERRMGAEKYEKLFWLVEWFREIRENGTHGLSSYEAKNLLHIIALFPSLYLQAKDILVYKKFSFEMARKDFSKDLWKPIETMTTLRDNWRTFPEIPGVRLKALVNPVASYQANAFLGDAILGMKKKNTIPVKELISQMHQLSEDAWSKISKRI